MKTDQFEAAQVLYDKLKLLEDLVSRLNERENKAIMRIQIDVVGMPPVEIIANDEYEAKLIARIFPKIQYLVMGDYEDVKEKFESFNPIP